MKSWTKRMTPHAFLKERAQTMGPVVKIKDLEKELDEFLPGWWILAELCKLGWERLDGFVWDPTRVSREEFWEKHWEEVD